MKRLPTILATVVLVAVLATYMCSFEVRSTEVAILKTFGKPVGEPLTEPGLKFKWFWPIQTVVKYDNRRRILEDKTEETITRDGKNVILTTYTVWRIADPRKFHENFQVEESGARSLRSLIQTQKNAEVGQHDFSEFASLSAGPGDAAARRPLSAIEDAILKRLQDVDQDQGVEVIAFGIKRLGLPQAVTSSIFDSMKAAQERKAGLYTSEGDSKAQAIRAEAEAARRRILSVVQQKVSQIEAEGQTRVSEYYKQFNEHPELRIFLDNLRAMKKALATRSTLIFDTRFLPFSLFTPTGREAVIKGNATMQPLNPSAEAAPSPAADAADRANGE